MKYLEYWQKLETRGAVRTARLCVITQGVVEFLSDVSGQPVGPSGFLNPDDGTDGLSLNVSTSTRCVITQRSAFLSCFTVEA
jgi:hypothetical protein